MAEGGDRGERKGTGAGEGANVLPPPRPPQFPPPHVPHVPPPRRFSLRDKAPELLVEAASVTFAVLLALGVDSWQEERREQRRADRARESIVAEIASNREEVSRAVVQSDSIRRDIALVAAQIERSDSGMVELNLRFPVLSAAAWTTAQTTGATQPLPFDWLLRVAQIYETQALYARTSTELLDRFGDAITRLEAGEGPGALASLRSWLNIGSSLAISLVTAYDTLLIIEGRPPAPPAVDTGGPPR
jgi:hypothetical protein